MDIHRFSYPDIPPGDQDLDRDEDANDSLVIREVHALAPEDIIQGDVFRAKSDTINSPSFEQLHEKIESLKDQFASHTPPSSQYLFVAQIPKGLFTRLEQEPDLFKGVRATILHNQAQVLYKITPAGLHEQLIWAFGMWVMRSFYMMGLDNLRNDYIVCGAARKRGLQSSKEPDFSLAPDRGITDIHGGIVPSLALEVGVYESTPQLRNDAHWWYANSGGATRVVILIFANHRVTDKMDIELWTEVLTSHHHNTRNNPRNSIQCTQTVHVENDVITGGPFFLPFDMIMRRPPANAQEGDLFLDDGTIRALYRLVKEN